MQHLLNQTITGYPKTTLNGYGKQSFGAPTDYSARVELKQRRRYQADGSVIVTDGMVMVMPTCTLNTGDKLVYNTVAYRVYARAERVVGSGTVHHYTLEIMKWAQ